jgi:hypothetical protein
MIQELKDYLFKRKLTKMGFDMEDEQNKKIAFAFTEKVGISKDHFLECMEEGLATKRLQDICEVLSGRKEAGRYLQREPLVIQCHTCQKNFSDKKGVIFVNETINLERLDNIIKHIIYCEGVICDCGIKRHYFDDCKKCKIKWTESSASLLGYRKDYPFTKKQREQINKYNKLMETKCIVQNLN